MAIASTMTTTQALSQLLEKLNQAGGFSISVLTDHHGLPLASAASEGFDPEVQSAVVAQIQKTITQVGRQ